MIQEVGHRTCQEHASLKNGKEAIVVQWSQPNDTGQNRQAGNRLAKVKICLRISGDPFRLLLPLNMFACLFTWGKAGPQFYPLLGILLNGGRKLWQNMMLQI